jgi:hypothetical protein
VFVITIDHQVHMHACALENMHACCMCMCMLPCRCFRQMNALLYPAPHRGADISPCKFEGLEWLT